MTKYFHAEGPFVVDSARLSFWYGRGITRVHACFGELTIGYSSDREQLKVETGMDYLEYKEEFVAAWRKAVMYGPDDQVVEDVMGS